MKKALILGIHGQDGSYLADFLKSKEYTVYGTSRRSAPQSTSAQKVYMLDLCETDGIAQLIEEVCPDEIYNLAAMSNDKESFCRPLYTMQVDGLAVMRLLESIRTIGKEIRFFQASSAELFGHVKESPQSEKTPFCPRSPYGIAKLFAHWSVINYREAYQIYACNGVLFNHESPRRAEAFVTRKITKAAVYIQQGLQEKLILGNLDVKRDWGYAKDYVEGMWLMLQQPNPQDYILATGKLSTVREFVEKSFQAVGIELIWEGVGLEEKGINKKSGQVCIEVAAHFFQKSEPAPLCGDPLKAFQDMRWQSKTSLTDLIHLMIHDEWELLRRHY